MSAHAGSVFEGSVPVWGGVWCSECASKKLNIIHKRTIAMHTAQSQKAGLVRSLKRPKLGSSKVGSWLHIERQAPNIRIKRRPYKHAPLRELECFFVRAVVCSTEVRSKRL